MKSDRSLVFFHTVSLHAMQVFLFHFESSKLEVIKMFKRTILFSLLSGLRLKFVVSEVEKSPLFMCTSRLILLLGRLWLIQLYTLFKNRLSGAVIQHEHAKNASLQMLNKINTPSMVTASF